MQLGGKSAALYGRFSPGAREHLAAEIERAGARVARDLMRRSDLLVIGARAVNLIDDGRLGARLAAARARNIPICSERRLAEALRADGAEPAATLPLAPLLAQTGLSHADADTLAAFDIVRLDGECCRFADAAALKSAAELIAAGRRLSEAVRILSRMRDAPKGRRKIALGPHGEAVLEWESGRTTLEGQFFLPLAEDAASVEDLFEAAAAAEAEGALEVALRFYDMSARADRKDPIAPYNLGNIRLAAEDFAQAAMAYRLALARDPDFVEARYNLAQSLERLGKLDLAREELARALDIEPGFADARFNLAQLELKRGEIAAAKAQFETYLAAAPPDEWAAKARKAIQYCAARLSA